MIGSPARAQSVNIRSEAMPILSSRDLDETTKFYAAFGFSVVGHWIDQYLILSSTIGLELHFWNNPAVESPTNDMAYHVRFARADEARANYIRWATQILSGSDLRSQSETDDGLLEFPRIEIHGKVLCVGGRW